MAIKSIYCHSFVSQENQNDLNQINDKENDPKLQVDGKLVGEINPDNFTYETDFVPKIKTEIKQENSGELPLLVIGVQSLNEPLKPKEEELSLDENDANTPQFDDSNTISKSENAPIEYGPHKFGCPFCSQLMYDSGDMKFHITKHTGEKPFSCNECEKSFISKSDLARHALTHTGEQPFECNDCGRRFSLKFNLVQHRLTHTEEKPFECNDCGKGFNRKDNLEKHRLIHSGEKPFECSDCGKRFYLKIRLERHRLNHTGEQPFECKDCGRKFNDKSNLRRHLKTVHSK